MMKTSSPARTRAVSRRQPAKIDPLTEAQHRGLGLQPGAEKSSPDDEEAAARPARGQPGGHL